jgi:hypothetical protein
MALGENAYAKLAIRAPLVLVDVSRDQSHIPKLPANAWKMNRRLKPDIEGSSKKTTLGRYHNPDCGSISNGEPLNMRVRHKGNSPNNLRLFLI